MYTNSKLHRSIDRYVIFDWEIERASVEAGVADRSAPIGCLMIQLKH